MSPNKTNIYINSKNKLTSETNSDFTVFFPSGFIKCDEKKEYLSIKVTQFTMLNNFYSVQEANNKYQLYITDVNDIALDNITYELPVGNYDVYELLKIMQNQLLAWLMVDYDQYKNKYIFSNMLHDDKHIFIKSVTANDFLGLLNNVLYLVPYNQSILSAKPINLRGDEMITLQITNLTYTNPIISNFSKNLNAPIVCSLPINVPPFSIMRYESADDSFNFKLENTEINSLRLICKNQDLEDVTVGDYQICLEVQRHSKQDIFSILRKIQELLSNIFISFWEKKKK